MEICNRIELKDIIQKDILVYKTAGYKNSLISFIMGNEVGYIVKYMRALRYEEYYSTMYKQKETKFYLVLMLMWRRRKYKIGRKTGISIPAHVVGYGFHIQHCGNIIINSQAKVGNNVICIGMNCVGQSRFDGTNQEYPVIEDNVTLGMGAIVLGNAVVKKGTIVAANAVVCKQYKEENLLLAGVPAKIIGRRDN